MKNDYSFIEYVYNPNRTNEAHIHQSLNALGFTQLSVHVNNISSLWYQNLCIIMLNKTTDDVEPCFAVIGFLSSDQVITDVFAKFNHDIEMHETCDPEGVRNILVLDDRLNDNNLNQKYISTNNNHSVSTPVFESIAGVVYDGYSESILDHYTKLGFRVTKQSDNYVTMVSQNNRFSILFDTKGTSHKIKTLIVDTKDVFQSTAYCVSKDITLKQFNINTKNKNNFEDFWGKINGYNCLAFGNSRSYTIENQAIEPLPNINIIFRMRNKIIHISEESIAEHHNESTT